MRSAFAAVEILEPRMLLAATYYISPVGNDANSGRSPSAPWKTLERINRKNWNPGDRILLLAGQTYRPTGSPGANVLVDPGFEEDVNTGWSDTIGTNELNSVVTNDPLLVHSGIGSLAIGTGTGARGQDVTASVRANQTYELSFWTRRTVAGTGTCQVGITFYSGTRKLGTFYKGVRNTSWASTQFSFVAPVGFDRAVVWAAKSSDLSVLYVDDFSLRTLPNGIILDSGDSGSAKHPVIVSTYGKKPKPAKILSGNGPALSIVNASNILVSNLLVAGTWNGVTGEGPSSSVGIDIVNTLPGNTKLSNIVVGAVESKGYRLGGIRVWGVNGKSGFSNVTITNSRFRWNGDAGIMIAGAFDRTSTEYANANIYITKNRVSNNTGVRDKGTNTGSGIQIGDVDGARVERNTVYSNGQYQDNADGGPVGIWTFDSNNVLIQYNESFDNHASDTSAKDGGGFDLDGGTTNSIVQYNYSHDNDGPGFLAVQFSGFRSFGNNIIRYNISQNDARKFGYGGLTLAGGAEVKNVIMEHNTVFVTPSPYTHTAALRLIGVGTGVFIRNNIFIATGGAHLVNGIPGSSIAQLNGNVYHTLGGPVSIVWQNVFYGSFDAWRLAGPENLEGTPTGTNVDPLLIAPGMAGIINDPDELKSLSQYMLLDGSPMIDAALDLPAPWDGYVGATVDYFGNPLPKGSATDIGAHELA